MKDLAHIHVKREQEHKIHIKLFFLVESLMGIFELMINIIIYFCSFWFTKPFYIYYVTFLITSLEERHHYFHFTNEKLVFRV